MINEKGHSILDSLVELDEQQVPDRALDNTGTTRMIEEIVDGLPEAKRACALMYYYDEMSVKDIAAVLGVPEPIISETMPEEGEGEETIRPPSINTLDKNGKCSC